MAVYTQLSSAQISDFLQSRYGYQLLQASAIHEGTENSNYLLRVQQGTQTQRYVLTLFEQLALPALQACLRFMQSLAQRDIKVPIPVADTQQRMIHHLQQRPCILTPFIEGQHPDVANRQQCETIADSLARIHMQHDSFADIETLDLLAGLRQALTQASFTATEQHLLEAGIQAYQAALPTFVALPKGVIHSDLFRDNTLFIGDTLQAILDFYSARCGFFVYDLAVLINDWCFDNTQAFNRDHAQAVISAYQQQRMLNEAERKALGLMLRLAACRFWVSRQQLQAALAQSGNARLRASKDPEHFKQRLLFHIRNPQSLGE